jgi:hypothetical protein
MIIRKHMPHFCAAFMFSLILTLGIQLNAHAEMVDTGSVIAEQRSAFDRHELMMALEREDVRIKLVELGVDPDSARDRVAAMNNDEIDQMANRMDQLPSGADAGGVIAVLGILFLVFIVTDLMGITNVFSFVR